MKKKLTPLQKEREKEYRRLRKGFAKYDEQGFTFPEELIPQNPAKVTQQQVENLKLIKPSQLTLVAEKVNLDTGEITQLPKRKTLKQISEGKPKREVQQKQVSKPKASEKIMSDYTQMEAHPNEEYIPTLTIFDAIREAIKALPDRSLRGKGVEIGARRNALLDILEDTLGYLDEEETQKYAEYLTKNQDTIFHELELIKYDSKEERIDASFAKVGQILNFGEALTAMQSESLNRMQEFYGGGDTETEEQ